MIDFDKEKYYYDKDAAEKIVRFIEGYIHHVKGDKAGQLIKLAKWQKEDILCPAFGIKRKSDGRRRFKYIYVEIPKGNAKSTLGAAIGLYLLLADGEQGAEIFSAAGDRFQAGIIFDIAKGMILESPELNSRCRAFQHSIVKNGSISFYKVISAEASTKHGFNPSGIIFDELHVQPDRELYDTLKRGAVKRGNFMMWMFTTAGYDKESICYEVHEYAEKVRQGIIKDDTFLPVLYGAPMDADIYSEETWRLANPGYGKIGEIGKSYFQAQINEIRNQPSNESSFRRLHLNQWVGTAETWITDEAWMENSGSPVFDGLCYGGLDLATVRDIAAFNLIFPGTVVSAKWWFFVPEDAIEQRSKKEGVNYDLWVRQGYITATPGNAIDIDYIAQVIVQALKDYNIRAIGFDRWGTPELFNKLTAPPYEMRASEIEKIFYPVGQGFASQSNPTKELEKLIANRVLAHGGNPVARWMMSNVLLETDAANNVKITKKRSREKVDGIVSLVNSIYVWSELKTVRQTSIYSERGIETI
jgi:phage terminase large subunit-like protein